MRRLYPFHHSIVRLGVRPDEPSPLVGPRPRGSRRPHTDDRVAEVRRLIEQTPLTYGEIAKRTGVGRASICRWTNDGGWQRHVFAPRATDRVPRERASAKLKRRTLAARLDALAERAVRELEDSASVDLDKLGEALELMKMAKLAAQGRRRRRRKPDAPKGGAGAPPSEPMRPIMQLCTADVDLHRAPRAAVDDFLANREPPNEQATPRRRGRRETRRNREHRWMMEKDRERP
jgi:hypothetical protein